MKIDAELGLSDNLTMAAAIAVGAENAGYEGIWTAESKHEPFFPLLLAAEHTTAIELGTCIAVAFSRNPMTLAHVGHDLQSFSGGRAILGLGSQVKTHITKRYSMPWSHPAPRMREFVLAIRSIWDAWRTDDRLDFRGDFYTHTVMTPMFTPPPTGLRDPKVMLAGVGATMTAVAGEVADGFLCHPFTTERYIEEVTLPAIAAGMQVAGRARATFELCAPVLVVTGSSMEAMATSAAQVRAQVAFCGSTPTYAHVLAHHGWDDLHRELNALSREGRWGAMGEAIDDEVLATFAVVAEPGRLVDALRCRVGGIADRVRVDLPVEEDPDLWLPIIEELKAIPTGGASWQSRRADQA